MISRLIQLDVQGFRSYLAPGPIPCDADVVVVYGPNGSGKTSLFSAIEFALTGTVTHLSGFSTDYPRSLQHVRSKEPGSVTLRYRNVENLDCEVRRHIEGGERSVSGQQLTRTDAQFYTDRCYLSQNQLARLFEAYEGGGTTDSDQPLVRFARDLLKLDPLENLTEGLHVILDVRRLANVSERFRRLKEERDGLPVVRQKLTADEREKRATFEEAIARVEAAFETGISPHGHVQWTEDTLRARREAVAEEKAAAKRGERLNSLQRYQGNLETATKILESSAPSTAEVNQAVRQQLGDAEKESEALREKLVAPVARLESVLGSSNPEIVAKWSRHEAARKLDAYEAAAKQTLNSVRTTLKAAADLRTRIEDATRRRSELQQELQRSEDPLADSTTLREWLKTLTAVAENIHDENCPVCKRDFSELGTGSLRRMVENEIERLGGDIKRLSERAARRSQLEAELAQASGLASALEGQLKEQSATFAGHKSAEVQLSFVLENEIPALSADRERLADSDRRVAALSREILNLDQADEQRQRLLNQISTLGATFGVPQMPDPREWRAAIMQTVEAQMQELAEQDRRATALASSLAAAERAAAGLAISQTQLANFEARRAQIEEAWRSADACVKEGKALGTAATNAKKTLLEEVFDGALNGLWRDLFRRLVKADRFTPQLKLERRGRQLITRIEGHADGVNPFTHAGSVLSAGNFNTAALSLFLSVHLLEQPKHQLLVLDDPVQNIDDVHVVQLASLLRTIVFESRRQLIVGVHERALFDYLCLELGPTSSSQSLLAVEVVGGADTTGTEVRAERRVWQNDKLQLGA